MCRMMHPEEEHECCKDPKFCLICGYHRADVKVTDLQTALLDLLHKIRDSEIQLIIGGGFGIYLKTNHIKRMDLRTLLDQWPESRSTNDLDLFLRPELLIESSRLKPLASAITGLDYKVVPGAENYQFVKSGPGGADTGSVKINILTGPQSCFQGTRVKADTRRARPTFCRHACPSRR